MGGNEPCNQKPPAGMDPAGGYSTQHKSVTVKRRVPELRTVVVDVVAVRDA